MHALATLALMAAAALPVSAPLVNAQVGGFSDGDMLLYSRNVTGSTSSDGGLVAVDPVTGSCELLVPFTYSVYRNGAAAFDAYRQRVVFAATLEKDGLQSGLWAIDAAGELDHLIATPDNLGSLWPTGDGRIYFLDPYDTNSPFKVIDAANRIHDLKDETGTTAFSFTGIFNHRDSVLAYDEVSNALIVAYDGSQGPSCSGGQSLGVTLKKVPLTPDGMQAAGPVACTDYDVDPLQTTEVPVDISRGPGGTFVIVNDNVLLEDDMPRVVTVDPVTLSVSPFAQPGGFLGADLITAGAYSSLRDEVLVLDTLDNVFRAFRQGDTGEGTVVTPSIPVSADPGSGEIATLLEVQNGACDGAFLPIGQGLRGTGLVVPALIGSGCAQLGGSVDLAIRDVVGGAPGHLLMGVNGAEVAYRGGTLYMAPVDLSWPVVADGVAGAAGDGSVDIPFGTITDPVFSGLQLVFQAGFHDLGAPQGASFTQAVRIEID